MTDTKKLVREAQAAGKTTLNEAEAKQVLRSYGVPVVKESVASTPEEAVTIGAAFGFPVVLKGLGARLTHKTERGLVRLNLRDEKEALAAAKEVADAAGADLEGYLVQPMVKGQREFVAGLSIDPQFGPVVMFGLGGIFTEALGDVVFRIAPFTEKEAEAMIDEIHATPLLGAFRGEAPVHRDEIVKVLIGLSRLGMEMEDVSEVDINPLVVGADGHITAVDALIAIGKRSEATSLRKPVDYRDLFKIFTPKTVAIVGASIQVGKWGQFIFTNLVAGGYEGEIFLVNPNIGNIPGWTLYKKVTDIQKPVDLAIVTIPAARVFALLPEFQAKGIKYVVLITAGFSETGEEGRQLEARLVREAEEAGILILGPNTMGICNPHVKFYCTGLSAWPKPGSISLIAQSGNLGVQIMCFADQEGIGIREFSGSGNEAMITIEDYLSAFEHDDLTKTVVLYIESVKNGRRFIEQATTVSRKKPIIALKGGRTEAGNQAAASHTGALASNIKIFNAACRQAGMVMANQPMELIDLSASFSALPLPKGNRVAIMTLGGGWGVVATDTCVESGLEIPPLPKDLIARIDEILPPYWSHANPVDIVGEWEPTVPIRVMEVLAGWQGCDAIIHLGVVGGGEVKNNMVKGYSLVNPGMTPEFQEEAYKLIALGEKEFLTFTTQLMEKYEKPIIGVTLSGRIVTEIPGSRYKGITFPSPERTVKALARMVEYQRWLTRTSG